MPELPVVALDCPGQPDPHVHAGKVARVLASVLDGTELVVVQGDTSSALGGRWVHNLPRLVWRMSKPACAAMTA